MKYKEGDKVRIKSLDWYNENKTIHGDIWFDNAVFVGGQSLYCGCELTIRLVTNNSYYVIENDYYWTDEMIEGLVESVEDRMKELRKMCTISLNDSNYTDKVEVLLNDYEYIEENGKSYFVKKKKKYPKTYEECCEIVKVGKEHTLEGTTIRINYKIALLESFQKLLICRDAYWKIAGDEMGLDKPWEPDWEYDDTKYVLFFNKNEICHEMMKHTSYVLAFPTPEMRDAFYENFKELIEQCKELL